MSTITWQVYEDNAGGLTLAVFDNQKLVYVHWYDCLPKGQLRDDISALANGATPYDWDGCEDNMEAIYNELCGLVADNDEYYYDRMGAAAQLELVA